MKITLVRKHQSRANPSPVLLRLFVLSTSLIAAQLVGCSTGPSSHTTTTFNFRPVPIHFNLGDENRFKFHITDVGSDGDKQLLLLYVKHDLVTNKELGFFLTTTADRGQTFSPERTLPDVSSNETRTIGIRCQFVENGFSAILVVESPGGRNFFYARSVDHGVTWSKPTQVNDEQDSLVTLFPFVQQSNNEVYCAWSDRRRGFGLAFFSSSQDGGLTWSPNQAIEYDFREAEQSPPFLISGAGSRLLAFWVDGRDRQTLKDIRCSYSDDRGQHWSPSQKVNDDNEHVWQGLGSAVARGNQISLVFEDFRERGEEGDNDWNIYFTQSNDNGETWSKNIRVNDVQSGEDTRPYLTIDKLGRLFCIWLSSRGSIFGDILVAQSTDNGRTWSTGIRINEGAEKFFRRPLSPLVLVGDQLISFWGQQQPGGDESYFTWLEGVSKPPAQSTPTPATMQTRPLNPLVGETVFVDDFKDDRNWQPASGTWSLTQGGYMGVEPGVDKPFASFARAKEPESYVMRGRFKLDPVDHRMASLYFRANDLRDRYYVIGNTFRIGSCLSIKNDDRPPIFWGAFAIYGTPLAERRFPFQNNRWYEFRLVVTPEQVSYYVDEQLVFSYEGKLQLPPGSIGVGGFSSAPTYFDDIAVFKIAK